MTRAWILVALLACGPSSRPEADGPCTGGDFRCTGDFAESCLEDGTWHRTFCDPVQALACDPSSARCTGACAADSIGQSYIGCEYFPTVTANIVAKRFHYAIVVSNTSSDTATITIDWGALAASEVFDVAPGDVAVHTLPWVDELAGCKLEPLQCTSAPPPRSALAPKGAYHVRSTRPVTVYQFNPLEYRLAEEFSYTNDASLLFPANALGTEYVVAGWQALGPSPGFVTITATRDQTRLTITSQVDIEEGHRTPFFGAGSPTDVVLDRGDAIQLFNRAGDLTGTRIAADAPIQVIAGHNCTNVPVMTPYCDHLEDALLPIAALGAEYIIAAPFVPSLADGKPRVVRIIATEPDTFLDITPSQASATYLARAGDFIEVVDTAATIHVKATRKVLVAQYMAGQTAGGDTGDPSMMIAVPVEQFRTDYLFHAPTNYERNYAEVIAPIGAHVTLDGVPLVGFKAMPDGTHGLLHVPLDGGIAGSHHITATMPVGVTVYGYGQYTSYWYPAGLDLEPIILE